MPQCSFKNCKNHSSRTPKKDDISFFRLPRDPLRCSEWLSIIARQRRQEYFKVSHTSIVCSKHFLESDVYVTPKGLRRLHKTAIPQIEENDLDVEDETDDKKTIEISIEPRSDQEVAELLQRPSLSLSNGSILDTPKNSVMQKELLACKRLLRLKSKKISILQKQNIRLKKKCNNLKDALLILNKRKTIDRSLLHGLLLRRR